ncbi:NUDIX hydrolase [Kitasatospora sp. NBC_01287]|uniref:NUDIX hydrolase n=1 Tax=Kitasatospora sp. NBC_01287 TaxID=2903573 RepID=UPI0022594750|nr:NUDIX hydrolase [Kitasatospora sp. NBC_01287]MCX4750103.1 NUDIX hydrolase [Kitasatospora sp. NBC_01287]
MTADTSTRPVRVRVCVVLVHDGRSFLIRRQRPAGLQLSLPDGPAEHGEDAPTAPRRELLEELGFDTAHLPAPPVLRFARDQETLRPGESAAFRCRHLLLAAHLPTGFHLAVAATEQDDPDQAPVIWVPAAAAACLRLSNEDPADRPEVRHEARRQALVAGCAETTGAVQNANR